jgi:hypothetical protein
LCPGLRGHAFNDPARLANGREYIAMQTLFLHRRTGAWLIAGVSDALC